MVYETGVNLARDTNYSFPTAFGSTPYTLIIVPVSTNNNESVSVKTGETTATKFQIKATNSPILINYLAIGPA